MYIAVIRPVLEYCVPVWHHALTKEQSKQIEAIQKRSSTQLNSISLYYSNCQTAVKLQCYNGSWWSCFYFSNYNFRRL